MAVAGRYSLKWHGHGGHLNVSISGLYRSEAFSDVILATSDGGYNAAHQFVLSASSPYLHKMFVVGSNNYRNSSKLVVVLPSEINHSILTILLQYIYRGEVIVEHEQVPKIMKAAEILQISSLCPGKVVHDLTSNNSNTVLKQQNKNSDVYNLDSLKTKRRVVHLDDNPELTNGSINKDHDVRKSLKNVKDSNNSEEHSIQARKKIRNHVEENLKNQQDDFENPVSYNIVEKMIVGEEILVKAEPIDWNDDKIVIDDSIIKQEMIAEEEIVVESSDHTRTYVPLTCDLCLETFSTPAMWVRHIEQKHPTTALASGKRPSVESSSEEYPPLHCELCQKVFSLPAEWVRHVQSHTEQQLADTVTSISKGLKGVGCTVCGKVRCSKHKLPCKSTPAHTLVNDHSCAEFAVENSVSRVTT